ncbi:lipopolysaccharide heptosyltransferase I [Acidithiobacillus sp.]|jgi:heptosyltransferase-1|uniref:lipopolysaccharide heptosyltransferase I n=1 Tax=Acidithiobacillus sp. TaxID=1872118 RepID=UPI0025C3C96A|nr:lipopolysaccharide heptosyltransferase I [Acidithiobacillus sp.]MCK9188192.1 lipopolysaccharide heptosyltransferase I [Acidithiobacillus sp.]MCK9360284.1 lipopolysaccharide heptosyltransferase I [Acidithiobacillus sp.]
MKILLLRLSSMGDVLHTLPAVTDLQQARPDLHLHWLVEPAFAPIALLHPGVARVIPFSLRNRKKQWRGLVAALRDLRRTLREEHYEHILDAQGLYKSALLGRLGGAPLWGLDAASAREPGATRLYHRCFPVSWGQSAISRNRQLFAQALDYPLPETPPDYGLQVAAARLRKDTLAQPWKELVQQPFVLGFHGTSWENKEWQEDYWRALAAPLRQAGWRLLLPAGSAREAARAQRIAEQADNVVVLPPATLLELAALIVRADAYVGMDTGLSYLAGALGLAGVTLYGPTARDRFSVAEDHQASLQSLEPCAPCGKSRCPLPEAKYGLILCQQALRAEQVWAALSPLLERRS